MLRAEKKDILLLDTGGFVPKIRGGQFAQSAYANLTMEAMAKMGYKANTLTILDYNNIGSLEKNLNFITSNLVFKGTTRTVTRPYQIISKKGIKIGITGITPKGDDKTEVLPPANALKKIVDEIGKTTDIIILLSQYSFEDTRRILDITDGIDIGFSKRSNRLVSFDKVDKPPYLIQINDKCSSIKTVDIFFNETRSRFTIETRRTKLNAEDFPEDPAILEITGEDIKKKVNNLIEKEQLKRDKELHKLSPEEYVEMLLKQQSIQGAKAK